MLTRFLRTCEGNFAPLRPLLEANNTAFRAALAYYRQERGRGERATDVSTFFKRRGLSAELERFLERGGKRFRRTFDRRWERFESLLTAMEE
jgi:hypothetical protein